MRVWNNPMTPLAAVENWETAPVPGQVAKRVLEGFTGRELPDRSAWITSITARWAYGSAAGAPTSWTP